MLPETPFRYENRSCRQHKPCQSLPPACLRSWLEFNFAGMPAVKTAMFLVAGKIMSSYVGEVSQAVPTAMSQVLRRHIRTRIKAHAWSVETGNICSVTVSFVWVGSQISPSRARKYSDIPSPGRTRSVKCSTPGPTKTIKSPPRVLPQPPPPPLYRDYLAVLLPLVGLPHNFNAISIFLYILTVSLIIVSD